MGDLMDDQSLIGGWKTVIEMISDQLPKLTGDQFDRRSSVHWKTGPKLILIVESSSDKVKITSQWRHCFNTVRDWKAKILPAQHLTQSSTESMNRRQYTCPMSHSVSSTVAQFGRVRYGLTGTVARCRRRVGRVGCSRSTASRSTAAPWQQSEPATSCLWVCQGRLLPDCWCCSGRYASGTSPDDTITNTTAQILLRLSGFLHADLI